MNDHHMTGPQGYRFLACMLAAELILIILYALGVLR